VACRSPELVEIQASVPKLPFGDNPGGTPWNEVLDTESANKSLKRNFDSGQKPKPSTDSSLLPQVRELIKVFMFKVEPLATE
jgi:hypothetical protein